MISIINDAQRGSNQQACPTLLHSWVSGRLPLWREGGRRGGTEGDGPIQRMDLGAPSPLLLSAPKRQLRGLLSKQTEPRRSQMTDGTMRKWCDSGLKTKKENVGIRESLLTTPWDPHPPPSILLPEHTELIPAQAYPRQGWWNFSLQNLNEHTY